MAQHRRARRCRAAIENGFMQREIHRSALAWQREVEAATERVVVGVNELPAWRSRRPSSSGPTLGAHDEVLADLAARARGARRGPRSRRRSARWPTTRTDAQPDAVDPRGRRGLRDDRRDLRRARRGLRASTALRRSSEPCPSALACARASVCTTSRSSSQYRGGAADLRRLSGFEAGELEARSRTRKVNVLVCWRREPSASSWSQPAAEDSPVSKVPRQARRRSASSRLSRGRPGTRARSSLRAAGLRLIDEAAPPRSPRTRGSPSSIRSATGGVLTELVEDPRQEHERIETPPSDPPPDARGDPRRRRPRSASRGAAREGQADRARADRSPARRGILRRDRPLRHAPLHRLRHAGAARAGRRRRDRARLHRRPARSISTARTSRSSAARSPRRTPRRSARSWTWPLKVGVPIIGLNDSGGARIQEGVKSLGGYAEIFWRNTQCSGVVPQLSGHHGPVRRRSGVQPGDHRLHVHGGGDARTCTSPAPDVVKAVTHEEVTVRGARRSSECTPRSSGVATLHARPTIARAWRCVRKSCTRTCRSTTPRVRPIVPDGRPRRSRTRSGWTTHRAGRPEQALRHAAR